jgi:hypothetical protein
MNEIELCAALRKRLVDGLANMQLVIENGGGAVKAPQVVDGFLPPKRETPNDDFPFVIVRPVSGRTDSSATSSVNIKILIGAFCDTYDGHIDVMLVIAEIRRIILENQNLQLVVAVGSKASQETMGRLFRLSFPLEWEVFEDQPEPEWLGHVVTRWEIPTTQENPGDEIL